METRPRTIPLDSVDAYNHLYGLETLNPLVVVIDLKKAKNPVNHILMDYGVYALYLKNGENCTVMYGREPYDYQAGTVVSFSPGQLIGIESDSDEIQQDVVGLLFHPDLIFGTPLGDMIGKYSFSIIHNGSPFIFPNMSERYSWNVSTASGRRWNTR